MNNLDEMIKQMDHMIHLLSDISDQLNKMQLSLENIIDQ